VSQQVRTIADMDEGQDCIMSLSDFPEPILLKVFM
jgi:hypothetical protein